MGREKAQVLRRKGRNPCELEQGSAANCLHDSYADNYTTSHRGRKNRCTWDDPRARTGWRERGKQPLTPGAAHGHGSVSQANYERDTSLRLSIVPRLVLY
jgi:hypothetical protein